MNRVSSSIEAVTVYREGALVRRIARLERGPDGWPPRVRLFNLPLTLDERSLRVKVLPGDPEQDRGALPVALDLKVGLAVGPPDPGARPADDAKLRAAGRQVQACEATLERLDTERDRLLALAVPPRPKPEKGAAPRPSSVESRLALLAFREAEATRLQEEIAQAAEALRLAAETLAKLEALEASASTAQQARAEQLQKTVEIGLTMPEDTPRSTADTATSFTLALEYLVPGARWSPAYTLALDPKLDTGRLAVRAAIQQATGEDWHGVALTLSTAEAMRWTELPELKAIRIGRRQSLPAKPGFRAPPEGATLLYLDHDQGFAAPASADAEGSGGVEPRAKYGSIGTALDPPTEALQEEAWEEDDKLEIPDEEAFDDIDFMCMDDEDDFPAESESESLPDSAGAPSGPPPMASREMPPPSPRRSRMVKKKAPAPRDHARGQIRALSSADDEAIAGASIGASDAHLDYGALRLPPSQHPDRGQLIVLSHTELTVQLIHALHLEIPELEVQPAQITQALQRAKQIANTPWPRGHHEPSPEGGFDYAYAATHPADVPSDGAVHTLPLLEASAELATLHVCVPRESQEVFREVRLKNPLDAPLLDGPVDVQIGEDFLLTSSTKNTPAHGELELGLGVEQAIKVARNVHFEEESTGLVRGRLGLEHRIEIELQNHLDREAEIEVRERLPVSVENDNDIEVEELASSPAWAPYTPRHGTLKGGRCWRVKLAPAEKKVLKGGYLIRIPKGHEVKGGNRREVS